MSNIIKNRRLLILIAVFIITAFLGSYYTFQKKFYGKKTNAPECIIDVECKLIYDSCDCGAFSIYDQNKNYKGPYPFVCGINNCSTYKVKAVCENFQCVKKARVKGYYQ